MKVSVIIPVYNAAEFIDATLASVAGQKRQPDEVVVVDDGSTDRTVDAVSTWTSRLPLRVIALPENIGRGLGAGGARARAIRESSGDVLALLDADDYWLPDHLAVMLEAHRRTPGLVTANYLMWMPGRSLGTTPASELVPVPPVDEQRLSIISDNFVFVSSVFTRALYDEAGPFRNIRCEDWDLWIRMVRTGAPVTMPGHATALYRQNPASVSGTDKLLVGDIDLLTELLQTCSAEERAVVQRALKRRHAKQFFLQGTELAAQGDIAGARRRWVKALSTDPSLRANRSRLNGRVSIRAAACIVAPRSMTRLRQRRQGDPDFLVGK